MCASIISSDQRPIFWAYPYCSFKKCFIVLRQNQHFKSNNKANTRPSGCNKCLETIMKNNKLILQICLALVCFFCVSCSQTYYQVYTMKSDNLKMENNSLLFEIFFQYFTTNRKDLQDIMTMPTSNRNHVNVKSVLLFP